LKHFSLEIEPVKNFPDIYKRVIFCIEQIEANQIIEN